MTWVRVEAHCYELWTRRLARPGVGWQAVFLLDYFPPAGPGLQPLWPFHRLLRWQVQCNRQVAGNGGAGRAAAPPPPPVGLCAKHWVPPCAVCMHRSTEHCCRRANEGHKMDATHALMVARVLRTWLQHAHPAGLSVGVSQAPS